MRISDYEIKSNGLYKSSSSPNYINLPLINHNNNKTKMVGEDLDRRNKIKDETLMTKKKFLKYRGLPEYYPEKDLNDSWDEFFKRREKEKQRKRMHNLLRGEHVLDTESDDDIFRNLNKSLPNKIEDKIKLKQYLHIKNQLAQLMMNVNDNLQKKNR